MIKYTPPPQTGAARTPTPRTSAKTTAPLYLPFTVIYDRRERTGGWRFHDVRGGSEHDFRLLGVSTREEHMVTADYTVDGCELFVERKSHGDFIGSLGGGHRRLKAEHERMAEINAAGGKCCLIVESSLDSICSTLIAEGRKLTPVGVMSKVAAWPVKYGVPWIFAGDRRTAEVQALRFFIYWWGAMERSSRNETQANGK